MNILDFVGPFKTNNVTVDVYLLNNCGKMNEHE